MKKIEAETVIDPNYEPPKEKESLALLRQRKEGKVLMEWMRTNLEMQSKESNKNAKELLELALIGIDEVISCYGKSCHEWADVLQMIKVIIKQQFEKQDRSYQ